jgi:hypothetical protein
MRREIHVRFSDARLQANENGGTAEESRTILSHC